MKESFTWRPAFRACCLNLGLIAAVTLGATAPAFAFDDGVQNNGLFELGDNSATPNQGSADILCSVTQAGPDWDCLFPSSDPGKAFIADDISAGSAVDRTVFSGGPGDKNSYLVSQWTWGTSSVPVKDDIGNAYAYAVEDSNGHLIIYVGAERLSNNGDAHIDVEFFQKSVGLDLSRGFPCPDGKCTFKGENTTGDLLVNMDFTNGGGFASLTVRERDPNAPNNYIKVAELNAEGCNDAATVCAFVNKDSIPGGHWDNYDSHGAVVGNIPTNGFTEWGIDVTALFLKDNLCFSTVQVKTRSSQSFTATLKDFALHSFQSCEASITTEINNTAGDKLADDNGFSLSVPFGTVVHDKAIVTGTVGVETPRGTVTFNRYSTFDCTGPAVTQTGAALTETVAPTPSTAGVANALSDNYTTTAGGFVSYTATYVHAADSPYPDATSGCEPLTVNEFNSAVNTDIRDGNVNGSSVLNQKVNAGTTIVDVATVSATNAPLAGQPDPTGQVIFHRYTTANCSGPTTDETVPLLADSDVNGVSTAVSTPFVTLESQFYGYWVEFQAAAASGYRDSAATVCEPICSFNNTPPFPPAP